MNCCFAQNAARTREVVDYVQMFDCSICAKVINASLVMAVVLNSLKHHAHAVEHGTKRKPRVTNSMKAHMLDLQFNADAIITKLNEMRCARKTFQQMFPPRSYTFP